MGDYVVGVLWVWVAFVGRTYVYSKWFVCVGRCVGTDGDL